MKVKIIRTDESSTTNSSEIKGDANPFEIQFNTSITNISLNLNTFFSISVFQLSAIMETRIREI